MKLIGDIHGNWQLYLNMINRRIEGPSIQLGDHGFGFKPYDATYPAERLAQDGHLFIRGNHDEPVECRQQPNYLGDVGFRAPVFFISGGFSIDYMLRTPGISWWEQEQLTEAQRKAALEMYADIRPDYVISHDAPTKAARYLLEPLIMADAGMYSSSSRNSYYEAKLEGVGQSKLSQLMQQMLDIHQPKWWVFAHFHTSKTFTMQDYGRVRFQVLGINEVADAPFGDFETEYKTTINEYGTPVCTGGHVHAFIAGKGNHCFVCGEEVQP